MNYSSILQQMYKEEKMAQEPWSDAVLYQPYEAEQILLAENASCLAVKAYLKMCNLPFDIRACANAEFMSPGGRMTKLPFIRAGAFVLSEFEPIVKFVENKGLALGQWLDEDGKADVRSYVSLVENIFTMAELYVTFIDEEVYKNVTEQRIGCVFPWPLNIWQNYKKRQHVKQILKVYQWDGMTMDDVIEKVEKCCESLTHKIEENGKQFFFSDQPCDLDAVAFGHLFTILTTNLPNMELAQKIGKYTKLTEFCHYIDEKYFAQPSTSKT